MKPIEFNKPHLIIMVGIPGSGKSYFADKFAKTFAAPLISFDAIYSKLESVTNDKKSLTESINQILIDILIETAKAKRTIVFDGYIYNRTTYDNLSRLAKSLGYEPLFIWPQVDIETAKKRHTKSSKDQDEADFLNFPKVINTFSSIDKTKKNLIVISGKHTYSSQLKIVLSYLSKPKN